ncbi:type VII secretion protein EssC [Halobacillus faecis]
MSQLYTFFNDQYTVTDIENPERFHLTVGNNPTKDIYLPSLSFEKGPLEILKEGGHSDVEVFQCGQRIYNFKADEQMEVDVGSISLTFIYKNKPNKEETFYIGGKKEITVGPSSSSTIHNCFDSSGDMGRDATLFMIGEDWYLSPGEEKHVFKNGRKIIGKTKVQAGDLLFLSWITLVLKDTDLLQVSGQETFETTLTHTALPTSEMEKQYPNFRRTPRMMYDLPEEKVTFSFPSQESDDHGRSLWMIILPPLVMLIVLGAVAFLIPRGIFIIISVMMFATTLITSTLQYFREKRRKRNREEKRNRVYTRYLKEKREELQNLRERQGEVLHYHYPSFETMKTYTTHLNERLWERTVDSRDFLAVRIGKAILPSSFEVSLNTGDLANREIDHLVEKSQEMVNVYQTVENVPLSIDLHSPLGLVGKKTVVQKEIHQLIGQLSFFHSYHDLRIITIFDEDDYEDWKWMRWLPHIQLPHSFAKGMIYNEKTRDQLLSSIYATIRDRDLDDRKGKKAFSPHLLFVVENQRLVSDHVIMEYLEKDLKDLGVSVIFAKERKEMLSDHIDTLIQYISDKEGEILIKDGKAIHKAFGLDLHQTDDNENYARKLYSLNHLTGVNNSIPDVVTFLDLFDKGADELPIEENWRNNQSSRSLAAPIGLKGKEDLVELNLHEKAHGPHGLLAGTTGSGKSELLQTYILSLAVHYHPHEVAFLLIDYKGGGMAQPFEDIPHLLGTITNIHESENFSTRALASINSELKRRQTLFDRYKVNHINDYTRLYKQKTADEPMPHLFIISDEFAELKNEEPEFISELVSTARIGRSLGVHLILATQKPGGIIDDQIWSNSRFRIALKVQDATDSKEILKNSDAQDLQTTGRGYLQVGNNEVYELFQSAWSGAPYHSSAFEGENDVSLVTDLGLVPVSEVAHSSEKLQSPEVTEITATVAEICKTQERMNIKRLPSPWLPPLPERIMNQEQPFSRNGEFAIGLKDEPEQQRQEPYLYKFGKDGNIGIFGSSGYGKTTTALTLLFDFAYAYSPQELHYYVFDFGNSSLLSLKQLSHTADYFRYDDRRKIEKFMTIMKEEMKRRKQLFLDAEVSTIALYNQKNDGCLPYITIVIDNFDLVKEEFNELENHFIQFARDGQTLGIFMIFTATRINSIRQPLMNNLKTKIIHYLMDASEKFALIGRTPYEIEPIPGRAMIQKNESYLAQIYLPADGVDDLAILDDVKRKVEEVEAMYKHVPSPPPIPMLPKSLDYHLFKQQYGQSQKEGQVAIGLDEEYVESVEIDLDVHCLITGQARSGKTTVLRVLLEQISDHAFEEIAVLDGMDRGLSSYRHDPAISYLETKEEISAWIASMKELLSAREAFFAEGEESSSGEREGILLVIDSLSRLNQIIDAGLQGQLADLMKRYGYLGFKVVAAGNISDFTKGFDSFSNELKQIRQAVLLMKKSDQSLFTLPFTRNEAQIQPGFGYYVWNGRETKIKIPTLDENEKAKHVSF